MATMPLSPPVPSGAVQQDGASGQQSMIAQQRAGANKSIEQAKTLLESTASGMESLAGVLQTIDPSLNVHITTMANAIKAIIGGLQQVERRQQGLLAPSPQPQPAEASPGM